MAEQRTFTGWHAKPAHHENAAGQFPARLRIEEELGSGGFATVYKANEIESVPGGRTWLGMGEVALKVYTQDEMLVNAQHIRDIQRQTEITAELQHPHIVAPTGFDQAILLEPDKNILQRSKERRFAQVMEHVDGVTLTEQIREHGLSTDEAVRILTEVGHALHHLHTSARLVHRDLKPANIILENDGAQRARLLDFNAAGKIGDLEPPIDTQLAMDPRPRSGERRVNEVTTDIYKWGHSAFYLLSGRLPIRNSDRQLQFTLEQAIAERYELQASQIPAPVRKIGPLIQDCLSADVRDRPSTMRKAVERLSVLYKDGIEQEEANPTDRPFVGIPAASHDNAYQVTGKVDLVERTRLIQGLTENIIVKNLLDLPVDVRRVLLKKMLDGEYPGGTKMEMTPPAILESFNYHLDQWREMNIESREQWQDFPAYLKSQLGEISPDMQNLLNQEVAEITLEDERQRVIRLKEDLMYLEIEYEQLGRLFDEQSKEKFGSKDADAVLSQQKLLQAKGEIERLTEELRSVKHETNESAALKDEKINALKDELYLLQEQHVKAEQNVTYLEIAYEVLEDQLDEQADQKESLEHEILEKAILVTELTEKLDGISPELREGSLLQSRIEKLREKLQKRTEALNVAKRTVDEKEAEINKLSKLHKAEVIKLEGVIATLENKKNNPQYGEKYTLLSQLREEVVSLKAKILSLRNDMDDNYNQLIGKKREIHRLEESVKRLESGNKSSKEKLKEVEYQSRKERANYRRRRSIKAMAWVAAGAIFMNGIDSQLDEPVRYHITEFVDGVLHEATITP